MLEDRACLGAPASAERPRGDDSQLGVVADGKEGASRGDAVEQGRGTEVAVSDPAVAGFDERLL